jgi:hypothetical protein
VNFSRPGGRVSARSRLGCSWQAEHPSFRFGQAAAASARAAAPRRPGRDVRPRVRRVLEGMTGTPACLCNTRSNILAANDLCLALSSGLLEQGALPLNAAGFVFFDDRASEFFVGWDTAAGDTAAALRIQPGKTPHDGSPNRLIGDLSPGTGTGSGSAGFAARWALHNVRLCGVPVDAPGVRGPGSPAAKPGRNPAVTGPWSHEVP